MNLGGLGYLQSSNKRHTLLLLEKKTLVFALGVLNSVAVHTY